MNNDLWRRPVGSIRPSHLMYTAGVGGLIDLPNLTVLVNGTNHWRHDRQKHLINEPRLLAAVNQEMRTHSVEELRAAPWKPDPKGSNQPNNVGIPVKPFPEWYRCTGCDLLLHLETARFKFINKVPSRPDLAKFIHPRCRNGKPRLTVPARFILACAAGHLDDFPYRDYVHGGGKCPRTRFPDLQMQDHGGNLGANVTITCANCGAARNISNAMGDRGSGNLPRCRGRHPHLGDFEVCEQQPRLLVLGASNQWFGRSLSVLAVPNTGASVLRARVNEHAADLADIPTVEVLKYLMDKNQFPALNDWKPGEVWHAWMEHQASGSNSTDNTRADVRTPEWEAFTSKPLTPPQRDFALNDSGGVPKLLSELLDDVVQVERLREVRALIGFSRLEAPDPEDPQAVLPAPIQRGEPKWVPASEVRGEGIFLRVSDSLIHDWEDRTEQLQAIKAHKEAYGRYRATRSQFNPDQQNAFAYWPGPRYITLHTLSHLIIRAIALECGYSSASLSERIYAGNDDAPRSGILIYTAVSDAEGSLGGLVSLGKPDRLEQIVLRALRDATQCSSDPLCAEREPQYPAEFLHGAACHVCTFVSETTCERGNRFLDRRFVVPFEPEKLALLHGTDLLDHIGSL